MQALAGERGAAGGAGLSLMSTFDLVVSGESAKFTMAYTRVGLTPDGSGTYFLPRIVDEAIVDEPPPSSAIPRTAP